MISWKGELSIKQVRALSRSHTHYIQLDKSIVCSSSSLCLGVVQLNLAAWAPACLMPPHHLGTVTIAISLPFQDTRGANQNSRKDTPTNRCAVNIMFRHRAQQRRCQCHLVVIRAHSMDGLCTAFAITQQNAWLCVKRKMRKTVEKPRKETTVQQNTGK